MEPSEDLAAGRRSLESILGYQMLDDLQWDSKIQQWVLHMQLTLPLSDDGVAGLIPDVTRWYVLIDDTYPWGEIKVYPAQDGGIVDTFQHQNCNRPNTDLPWRQGDLCIKTSLRSFGRRGYDTEPYEASTRLAWHVRRCKAWLELANVNQLCSDDDPFELPHYPTESATTLAFSENAHSFDDWQHVGRVSGLVRLQYLHDPLILFVKSFHGFSDKAVITVSWGTHLENGSFHEAVGIWVRLPSVPVSFPWKAPLTWADLFRIATEHGVNLITQLVNAYCSGWYAKPTFLLLGFPIAAKISLAPQQMHWLAIKLKKPTVLKGFRPNSPELPGANARTLFRPKSEITWMNTENWDREEINARGRLAPAVTAYSILIIGAGAIGSALSELLSRAGCHQITLIDNDIVEIGNMSRHTLTMDSLHESKAEAIAKRLNKIFPYNTALFLKRTLKQELAYDANLLARYNVIIDTTGSDQVLYELAQAIQSGESKFVSLSLGLYARRLFCFTSPMTAEMADSFRDQIHDWLVIENEENEGQELPRDGVGCWHPLFPARADDVWMLVSASMKIIEPYLLNDQAEAELIVFEQKYIDGKFAGISVAGSVN